MKHSRKILACRCGHSKTIHHLGGYFAQNADLPCNFPNCNCKRYAARTAVGPRPKHRSSPRPGD